MGEESNKYEIVARLLSGPITIGYKLFRNDKFHSISTEKTIELIENGSISNGKVIKVGNEQVVVIDKNIGSIKFMFHCTESLNIQRITEQNWFPSFAKILRIRKLRYRLQSFGRWHLKKR